MQRNCSRHWFKVEAEPDNSDAHSSRRRERWLFFYETETRLSHCSLPDRGKYMLFLGVGSIRMRRRERICPLTLNFAVTPCYVFRSRGRRLICLIVGHELSAFGSRIGRREKNRADTRIASG